MPWGLRAVTWWEVLCLSVLSFTRELHRCLCTSQAGALWSGMTTGQVSIAAPYSKVPVFVRGGSILPRRDRVRRSSALMHGDPVSLVVALDNEGKAGGTLFLDDGQSYEYRNGGSIYINFSFEQGKLEAKLIQPAGISTGVWLERVVVLGAAPSSGPAKVLEAGVELAPAETTFDFTKRSLVIRKPGVNMGKEWSIQL